MDLDIDQFITEIENREAIWNMQCEEYSDRVQKVRQWEEIIDIFTDEDASAKQKKKLGNMLQKRWRTLRDAFVKQRRELATTEGGSAASNKKLYKYYNKLLFLLPVVEMNTTKTSIANRDNNDSVERPRVSKIIQPEAKKIKISDSTEKIGTDLVNALKSALKQNTEVEDPDRQFMLSLVSDFKNVPQRLKPAVKINILKCIMNAQNEEVLFQPVEDTVYSNMEESSYSNIPTIIEERVSSDSLDSHHSEDPIPPKVQRVYKIKRKTAQVTQKS